MNKICTKCSTLSGYSHNAKSEKDLKSAEMTTSKYVCGKISETHLVQRKSKILKKKKYICIRI